jgi:hypothetical protein
MKYSLGCLCTPSTVLRQILVVENGHSSIISNTNCLSIGGLTLPAETNYAIIGANDVGRTATAVVVNSNPKEINVSNLPIAGNSLHTSNNQNQVSIYNILKK